MLRELTTLAVLGWCALASGQTPATDGRPQFEAASVKVAGRPSGRPEDMALRGGPGSSDPSRITYRYVTLGALLARAYDVRGDQIIGPDWIKTEYYAVNATLPPNTTMDQFRLMIQNLLAERFHLTLHHGSKEFPAYDLVVAEGGHKLKEVQPDNVPTPAPGPIQRDRDGYPILPPGLGFMAGASPDGLVLWSWRQSLRELPMRLGALVNAATGSPAGSQPRITDKTGLTGTYEFKLAWAMPSRSPQIAGQEFAASEPPLAGPNIFAALEKQLGLKLVKNTVTLETLVIDKADRAPTEN